MTTLAPTVRRRGSGRRARAGSQVDGHHSALNALRAFLRGRTCYDAFPISFRLIVLDTKLNVKKALQCLLLNSVVSAPLWNSDESKFAGMLTVLDIIHLIQYYYKTANSIDNAAADVEHFRLESLRDIERNLNVPPPPLHYEHPRASLFDAATLLIKTHARRLPLLDNDTDTGHEVIVSTLTQYRLLKFISINCPKEIQQLHASLFKLGIGTYVKPVPDSPNPFHPIRTAKMNTPVLDVVHMFSESSISAVPIVDDDGVVINLYETVDVITLVHMGAYHSLDLTIAQALDQRAPDFPGVVKCAATDSLGTLLQLIKKRRVHRLVVVENEGEEGSLKGRLLGIITLSDVLRYVIGDLNLGKEIPTKVPTSSVPATPSTLVPPTVITPSA